MDASAWSWAWRRSVTSSGSDRVTTDRVGPFRLVFGRRPYPDRRPQSRGNRRIETSHRRGIVPRLMSSALRPSLAYVLGALAIASIAAGPSPSAAAAELTARVKRDRATQQSTDSQAPESAPDQAQTKDTIAPFVAPTSAKPAEVHGTGPSFIALLPCVLDADPAYGKSPIESDDSTIRLQSHRFPHQPNAPPQAE